MEFRRLTFLGSVVEPPSDYVWQAVDMVEGQYHHRHVLEGPRRSVEELRVVGGHAAAVGDDVVLGEHHSLSVINLYSNFQ